MTGRDRRSTLPPCVYTPDPRVPADQGGRLFCRWCGLPRRHPRHTLPDVDPDQTAAEARRIGEREG